MNEVSLVGALNRLIVKRQSLIARHVERLDLSRQKQVHRLEIHWSVLRPTTQPATASLQCGSYRPSRLGLRPGYSNERQSKIQSMLGKENLSRKQSHEFFGLLAIAQGGFEIPK